MKIIFYADYFLVLNMIMNIFLLVITMTICRKKSSFIKMAFSALLGSLLELAFTKLSFGFLRSWYFFEMFFQSWVMVSMSFQTTGKREKIRLIGCMYLVGMFVSGCIQCFYHLWNRMFGILPNTVISMSFILVGGLGVTLAVYFLWQKIKYKQEIQKTYVTVRITRKGETYTLKALYDTGNHLTSPYTGEPVHIISCVGAEKIGLEIKEKKIAIPYHSIGGNGILWAYHVEGLEICGGQKKKNALVAVSDALCKEKEIQMILNCSLD